MTAWQFTVAMLVSLLVTIRHWRAARDALGAVLVGSSVLYFAIADRRDAAAQAMRTEPDAAR